VRISLIPALAAILFLIGCDQDETVIPATLTLRGSATRPAALGSTQALQFTLFGPKVKTVLGGSDTAPAPQHRVTFAIVDQPQDSGAILAAPEATTDAGGDVTTSLQVGRVPGIYRVRASLPNVPAVKPLTVTILGGVILAGDNQDGGVNGALDVPLTVRVQASPDAWARDAAVEFDLRHAPKGTRLGQTECCTAENGTAAIEV